MSDNSYFPLYTLDPNLYPYLLTQIIKGIGTIPHTHDFYEFIYIQEGSATNIVNDVKFNLSKGDVALVRPGEHHQLIVDKDCLRRDICIDSDFFEQICNAIDPNGLLIYLKSSKKVGKFTPNASTLLSMEERLDYFLLKSSRGDTETKLLTASILTEILFQLVPKEKGPLEKNKPEWLNTIMLRFQNIEYVQKGLPAIVSGINYNQIYINRVFKQYTGMNLTAYLNEMKLKKAAFYLRTSDHSANEISEMLGFSSTSFFYKQFKIKYGVTPRKYRENSLPSKTIWYE